MIHCILLLCYSSTIAACHNLSQEANSSLQSCILVSVRQGKAEFTAHPLRYAQCTANNGKLAGVREKQERGCSLKENPGKPSNNSGMEQGVGWAELKGGPSKLLGEIKGKPGKSRSVSALRVPSWCMDVPEMRPLDL